MFCRENLSSCRFAALMAGISAFLRFLSLLLCFQRLLFCHILQDKPDAPICSLFLVGRCKKGVRCLKHHCCMPYHWQYNVPNVDTWKSFSEKDNIILEQLYCDVSVDTRLNFKPIQALDFSLLEREGSLPHDQEYDVTIDLDDMLMFATLNFTRETFVSQLRRLSTEPCHTHPCNSKPTIWTWYWKENDNTWHEYDKDHSGRDLQVLIELAFLDSLEQGKAREKFKFTTPEHEYNLFFNSGRMYQVNLKTGTKRPVKRRPSEFVSNEVMDDLKWEWGDSSVREQLRINSAKHKCIPSDWSFVSSNAQYERVLLLTSSHEFKSVEQLFRRTMNDYVVIINIARVQNLFMWEKYYRKREHMMATAKRTQKTVNEKQLFHGTSPDAVKAICKQNFDWRLHGKNATVYGQGSYFAANASYSHVYASKDVNLSQFMFLAKVLVGSYTTGHSSYRRPPQKNPSDPASDLYDSCVDNQANPTIFIVFDTDQFYPEYIIQYSTVSQTTSATASYALPQLNTAHLGAKPPSSQQQKGNLKHPARSSSTVATSHPNGSTSQSSYLSTTTGPTVHQSKTSIHVVSATNSNVPVSRSGHSSTASRTNPSRMSTPLGTASNATGYSAQSGYPSTAYVHHNASAVRSVNQASASNTSGSSAQSGNPSTAFSSSHGIASSHHSAVPSVNQASASNTNYATPSYSTSPFHSSTSRDVFPVFVPPKKKKGCLIM